MNSFLLTLFLFTVVCGNTILDDIIEDIISIINGELEEAMGDCVTVEPTKIDFLLYNRLHLSIPISLNRTTYQLVNPKLPTKFLIHGWSGSVLAPYIIDTKKAYLNRRDYNIIAVNWSEYAIAKYASAHCNLPKVGKIVGNFLYNLVQDGRTYLNLTHLVGYSLGAHISGYVGQFIRQRTRRGKIARITGLDPAGPLYLGLPERQRLSEDDAQFVDVIHTNAGVFGYPFPLGHADFYPNCGVTQKGCVQYDPTNNATLIKKMIHQILCNHNRSNEYFIESITSRRFLSKSCLLCNFFCSISEVAMGEHCTNKVRGVYYLRTNKAAPFAKG